jgi:uncharacterized protein (TIGR02246 family)
MTTQIPPMDVRESIGAANTQFMTAFGQGDAAGVAACYTDDALVLPPHSEEVRGRAAIEAFWRGVIELGLKAARLETLEAASLGDTVYEVGRYTLLGEGGQVADRGKYVVLWRSEGERWRIHRDIWNTSAPAPAQ